MSRQSHSLSLSPSYEGERGRSAARHGTACAPWLVLALVAAASILPGCIKGGEAPIQRHAPSPSQEESSSPQATVEQESGPSAETSVGFPAVSRWKETMVWQPTRESRWQPREVELRFNGLTPWLDEWGRETNALNFSFMRMDAYYPETDWTPHQVAFYFSAASGRFIAKADLELGETYYDYASLGPIAPYAEAALFLFLVTGSFHAGQSTATVGGAEFQLVSATYEPFSEFDCNAYELVRTTASSGRLFVCLSEDDASPRAAVAVDEWTMGLYERLSADFVTPIFPEPRNQEAPPVLERVGWNRVTRGVEGAASRSVLVPPMTLPGSAREDVLLKMVEALTLDLKYDAWLALRESPYVATVIWLTGPLGVGDLRRTPGIVHVVEHDSEYAAFPESTETEQTGHLFVPLPTGHWGDSSIPIIPFVSIPGVWRYPSLDELPEKLVPLEEIEESYADILPTRTLYRMWYTHYWPSSCSTPCGVSDHDQPASLVWVLIEDCAEFEDARYAAVSAVTGQFIVRGRVRVLDGFCTFGLPE